MQSGAHTLIGTPRAASSQLPPRTAAPTGPAAAVTYILLARATARTNGGASRRQIPAYWLSLPSERPPRSSPHPAVHAQSHGSLCSGRSFICNMTLMLLLKCSPTVTGSTILSMLMHGLINFEAMLETFVALHA